MTPNNYNGLLNTNSAMQGLLLPEPAKPSFGLNYAANILANPSGGTGRSFLQSLLTPLVGATQMYSQQLVDNRKMRAANAASLLDFQKTQLEMNKLESEVDRLNMFNKIADNIGTIGTGDLNQIIPKLHIAGESGLANYFSKQLAPFGTGTQGSALNIARKIAPKIRNGTATDQEIADYRTAAGVLGRTTIRQIPDAATGQTITVEEKGFTLGELGFPTLGDNQESTTGGTGEADNKRTTIAKSGELFTQDQNKNAGFAFRMQNTLNDFNKLEDEGYDPRKMIDIMASDYKLMNFFASAEGQVYNRAKKDFITAQLRQESGAVISPTEFADEERKFFPMPGDNEQVIQSKRLARQRAFETMRQMSGGAYDVKFGKQKTENLPDNAILINTVKGKQYYQVGDKVMVRDVQ